MYYIERREPRQAYIPWLQQLQDFGDVVEVRGRQTKEFINAITVITEPWHPCILIPSRRWNPWLALSEALWILAGRNDVAAIKPYNNHIDDFSDDGVTLYGAYGARIYHQIDPLIERLRKDPSDRRAVISIWDARSTLDRIPIDLVANSKDPPCNTQVMFKLRGNKLHMTVICRSNDLHWGLMAVNLPTFGILQQYIAARLGVGIGTQTHLSNSLHIYTDEPRAQAITERMLYNEKEDMPKYPEHKNLFPNLNWLTNHKEFASLCSQVLDNKWTGNEMSFLKFAQSFLTMYRKHEWQPHMLQSGYEDWVMAGQMFIDRVWHK